jgi:caa(3)-type oxidase subunit IV
MATHAAQPVVPHKAHPTARTYLLVFAFLTVFTIIEVAVGAFIPGALPIKVALLVGLAVIKAALVVLYYMHLRYDSFWYWIILVVPVGFVLLLARYLYAK